MKKGITALLAATLIGTGVYTVSDWMDPPAQTTFQPVQVATEQSSNPAQESATESPQSASESDAVFSMYPVVRIVDGDTIEVEIDGTTEKVRLIGIDTPESVHPDQERNVPYGPIASAYTKEHLAGRSVGLEFDVQERDKYGRLLAYIYLEGKMFNETLLEYGHAVVSTYPPNVKYVDRFTELQRQARENGYGLWSEESYVSAVLANSTGTALIGNLNSFKFHVTTCVHVSKMSEHNKIHFSSREAALSEGYQPCKTCTPSYLEFH